jgi:hypothetical protein
MTRFFVWLQYDEGWKSIMAIVYALICLVDFIIVPGVMSSMRRDVLNDFVTHQLATLDPTVQIEMIKALARPHQPFTLQGAGVFHIAFGALLTGSAISKFKEKM